MSVARPKMEVVGSHIDEEGIDYIIQDGEDMVKRCLHDHHTQQQSHI